jgi:hypothetical protein
MLKQMTNVAFFSALFLSCNSSSIQPPKGELCIIGDGVMICQDDRINPPEYERPITINYICTSPEDFKAQKDHLIDVTTRLQLCLKNPKSCR